MSLTSWAKRSGKVTEATVDGMARGSAKPNHCNLWTIKQEWAWKMPRFREGDTHSLPPLSTKKVSIIVLMGRIGAKCREGEL